MKVTREKAAEHRAAIVKAASRLFRERGFENVGVAEITRAAGLTHGGFYGHFKSKEALAAEACGQAFADSLGRMQTDGRDGTDPLAAFIARYLSDRHVARGGPGCPMAALSSDIPRQDAAIQTPFAQGVEDYVEAIAARLPADEGRAATRERRKRAIVLLSTLVGGLSLARATAHSSPDLSGEILAALRAELAGTH